MKKTFLVVLASVFLFSCKKDSADTYIKEKINPCEDPRSLAVIAGVKPEYPCLIPQEQKKALLIYFTSVECEGSGSWGNSLLEDILLKSQGKVEPLVIHFRYNDPFIIRDFADSFVQRYDPLYSPYLLAENLCVTGENTIYPIDEAKDRAGMEIDRLSTLPPDISPALRAIKSDNKLKLYCGVRFEEELEGTYTLGLYVVEDSVPYYQLGTMASTYYHENVVRHVVDSLPFGIEITSGKVVPGSIFLNKKVIHFDNHWVKENTSVLGVIWYAGPDGKREVVNVIRSKVE